MFLQAYAYARQEGEQSDMRKVTQKHRLIYYLLFNTPLI